MIERLQPRLGEGVVAVPHGAEDGVVVERHLGVRVLESEAEVPVSGELVVGDVEVGEGEGGDVDGWELGADDDEEDEEDEAEDEDEDHQGYEEAADQDGAWIGVRRVVRVVVLVWVGVGRVTVGGCGGLLLLLLVRVRIRVWVPSGGSGVRVLLLHSSLI